MVEPPTVMVSSSVRSASAASAATEQQAGRPEDEQKSSDLDVTVTGIGIGIVIGKDAVGIVVRKEVVDGGLTAGQRQRLCLARALALDPAVLLLLHEPTSALVRGSRNTVEASVAALRGRRTVVLVSHDADQVARLCDEVVDL